MQRLTIEFVYGDFGVDVIVHCNGEIVCRDYRPYTKEEEYYQKNS